MSKIHENGAENYIFEAIKLSAKDKGSESKNYTMEWDNNWEKIIEENSEALMLRFDFEFFDGEINLSKFEAELALETLKDSINEHYLSEEIQSRIKSGKVYLDLGSESATINYVDLDDNHHVVMDLYYEGDHKLNEKGQFQLEVMDIPKYEYDRECYIDYHDDLESAITASIDKIESYEFHFQRKAEYEAEMELEKKKSSKRPKP